VSIPFRQRLSFFIPALACLFCLGSAFAVSTRVDRPVQVKTAEVATTSSEAKDSSSSFRFASPATVVLGLMGFAAMMRRPS
jgi:hypothetical protein